MSSIEQEVASALRFYMADNMVHLAVRDTLDAMERAGFKVASTAPEGVDDGGEQGTASSP